MRDRLKELLVVSFRMDKLSLENIDNGPILKINSPRMAQEEMCLFHNSVKNGDEYFSILHKSVSEAVSSHLPAPVVRFADGEYAFYNLSLKCNGLYQQAESVEAIKRAIPLHVEALKKLVKTGKIAPLIFPGNMNNSRGGWLSFLRKKNDPQAIRFVNFLNENGIELAANNYIPFYIVYAYLTSREFARMLDGKNVCIVNSEYNKENCYNWFNKFASSPKLSFSEIPDSLVATSWGKMQEKSMTNIPQNTDLCLVGAGIGALLVCVDISSRFSIPAIDAGHVLNMMNGREDKSNGPRLYTIRKSSSL